MVGLLLLSLVVVLVRGSDGGEGVAAPVTPTTTSLPGKLGPVFRPMDGVAFEELPPRLLAEMARTSSALQANPGVKEALRGIAGRSATKNGSWVGVVLAFDIKDEPGLGESFLRGASVAIGPNRRELRLEGRRVVAVTDSDGLTTLLYYGRGLALFVGGSNDTGALEQVMTILLENGT